MPFDAHNIGTIFLNEAKTNPNEICLEQDGKRISKAEIVRSARSFVPYFQENGVSGGSSVAILAVDRVKGFEALLALWSIGAAVLFLDPRQPIAEMRAAQDVAGVDSIFTDSESFSRRGGFGHIKADRPSADAPVDLRFPDGPSDLDALILSSSGTTGVPRYRRVTHRAFIEGVATSGRQQKNPVPFPAVSVGSFAFGAVLAHWIRLMIHGQFVLSLPLFFPIADLHQALLRRDIASVGLPPVLIRDLLEFHVAQADRLGPPAYPHLESLASVGGPILPHDLMKAYRLLSPHVRNVYSMSGVGGVSILAGKDILSKPNSVGKPYDDVCVRIEGAEGALCDTGQVGRIVITPNWKAGADPVDTGDLGWLDSDGYLFVEGRSGQMATRNGINLSLRELEQDISQINGVRECTAFLMPAEGSPDDVIFLAVETPVRATEMQGRIKLAVAAYRRPDRVLVRQHLPRNASDKIALGQIKAIARGQEGGFVDL